MRDLYVRTFTSCFTIKSETTAAVQKKKEREGERRKPCCRLFVLLFYLLLGIPNKFRENNSTTLKSASKFCAVLPPGGSSTPEKVWHSVEKDRRRPIISQVILVPTNPVPRWMGRCGRCFGWWGGQLVVGQWSFSQESRVGHRWVHNDLRILHFGARAVFVCAGQTSVRRGKVFTFEEAAGGIGWWWGATYSREEGAAEAQRRTEWTDMYSFARSRVSPAERHQHCKWLHTHSDRITRELIPHMMELLVTFPNIFLTDAHKERCESCILNCF